MRIIVIMRPLRSQKISVREMTHRNKLAFHRILFFLLIFVKHLIASSLFGNFGNKVLLCRLPVWHDINLLHFFEFCQWSKMKWNDVNFLKEPELLL